MTIPKTLAALPKSQYATALLLTSGKRDFVAVAPFSRVCCVAVAVDKEAERGIVKALKFFCNAPR